jgi:Ca-activated chloride channel family protein
MFRLYSYAYRFLITSSCRRCGYLLALGVMAFLLPAYAAAQTSDDVHITPRVKSEPPGDASDLAVRMKPLRVDVNLVLVPVTVTDVKNRPVTDLSKENFRLFEGEKEQRIQDFFAQDARISVGLLVDLSSSMANKIDAVHEAINEFFRYANPEDDYFVITFADRPKLLADTTQSIETIQSKLAGVKPKGNTALADAIYMGVAKLRSARYARKALVIISDGGDNNSRHGLRQTKHMVRESDTQVYAIDVCDSPTLLLTKKLEERFGRQWLTEVTESTGGRTIVVDDASKIPEAAARTSLELRNQYVLGYRPEHPSHDGKWRKIKVRVSRPEPSLPLQVYYKTGYMERRD